LEQTSLFGADLGKSDKRVSLGSRLFLDKTEGNCPKWILYRGNTRIKEVDLADRVAKRLLVVEAVDLGATKSRLARALRISRQSIHNYLETRKHFGLEGLIHGYTPRESRSLRKQREMHCEGRIEGNKAKQLAEIRKARSQEEEARQLRMNFSFADSAAKVEEGEQPYSQTHEWESSRYAGVFTYLFALLAHWKWLQLVMGHFGSGYKIFMVFLLMAARNIRSVEQLKNVRSREAGLVLGLAKLPSRPKIWEWFYRAAQRGRSAVLLRDYFRHQLRSGLVGLWLWFTDGHLLPYTGKEAMRYGYNTQRRMPVPGQTNMVTCDVTGRVVDFEIQEGKGDLRSHILAVASKWREEIAGAAVNVFDREGHGAPFFSALVRDGIAFVTWEKHADAAKLAAVEEERFHEEFKFNGKQYGVFEEDKDYTHTPEDTPDSPHNFKLRRIYLWNKSSKRRACGLAWDGGKGMSTVECARAILHRWGASENSFKHIQERHPFHYRPGFKLVESERQEIDNPAIKGKNNHIQRIKTALGKLYKKLSKAREVLNKDGSARFNSVHEQLKMAIVEQEATLDRTQEERAQLPRKIDVSSLQDYRSFKRIDNEGKNLFDFVTCSVWNARKQMVDWLRPYFDQDNEVVDLFYAITFCHGWIKSSEQEVLVRLEPLEQGKRRRAQEQLCRKLTNLRVQTPTGKHLTIEVGESPL
jgi:hypothetical protein